MNGVSSTSCACIPYFFFISFFLSVTQVNSRTRNQCKTTKFIIENNISDGYPFISLRLAEKNRTDFTIVAFGRLSTELRGYRQIFWTG